MPSVAGTSRAAAAAPLPPLEPPQIRSVAHGFRAGPKYGLVVIAPSANSCVLSLPTTTAPAARSASTVAASVRATFSARMRDAAVVRAPATSITSLTAIGTPWRGPRGRSAVEGVRLGERLLGPDADEGVELGIELGDAPQALLDRGTRAELAGSDPIGQRGDAHGRYRPAGGVSGGSAASISDRCTSTVARNA